MPTRVRPTTLTAATLVPTLLLTSCSTPWTDSPTDTFLTAINDGHWTDAAADTTDPTAAETWLTDMAESTGDTTLHLDNDNGTTTATWTVPTGDDITSTGTLTTGDDGKVTWNPTIFSTDLTDNATLTYTDDRNYNLQILDRRNDPQLTWTPVTVVTATKETDLDALADAVHPVIPDLDTTDAATQIQDAGDNPTTLFSLRNTDWDKVSDTLTDLPGISTHEDGRLLPDPASTSPLDTGLTDYWTRQLDDTAGWTLTTTTDGTPGTVLGQKKPDPHDPVHTTMDLGAQAAANRAVDTVDTPAAIVALSVSTGGILTTAQNDAASADGTPALTGLFPPGSTFKTVTTTAALTHGTVHPDDTVACPATVDVDGRTIPNDHDFTLGDIPLHTAFARSCNTTQALISRDLAPDDLKNTAAQYGLGVDFDAPGMTTVTGSVPVTDQGAARVESAIGQGEVVASPFGLALMEASVANDGHMVTPSLVTGEKTTADQDPAPVDPTVIDALRSMMRETVDSGTASSLKDIPGLGGKTGTAEVDGGPAHGWFVGVVGDVAFCTFIAGADSSTPAVDLAGTFLRDDAMGGLIAQR